MGLKLRTTSCSIWRTAFLVSALIVLAGTVVPDGACAEGPFDFLFGGFQRPTPPPRRTGSYSRTSDPTRSGSSESERQ